VTRASIEVIALYAHRVITPSLLTLEDMFGDRVHYEVPIYQRSYVWNEEEQWQPLWEDVRDTAAGRLSGAPVLAHFLGAIVIELIGAEPGRVKTFSVIDGQQRLTTLQILFAALRKVAEVTDPDRVGDIDRLLRNTGRHTDGQLHFKVATSEHDRPALAAVMEGDGLLTDAVDGIRGAFNFFRERLAEWVDDESGEGTAAARLDAMEDTLEGLLQVVAIQLDGSSEAQIVFETLNSRGADLTSLDLVKNTLLRQAQRDGADVGELHERCWQPSLGDADYWLEEVRQGRYTRPRADLFLMHWLTMRTGAPPKVQRLFAEFRQKVLRAEPAPSAEELIAELGDYAAIYRSFDSLDRQSIEGQFFWRLDQLDTTTLLPVAMLLFGTPELSNDRRRRALRALESWLVRRMILGATTQHYNRLLAALLASLHEHADLGEADDVIIDALRGFENPTDKWPDDTSLRDRLIELPVYGWINQRRVRLLLEACEKQMATNNMSEQIDVPTGLTIEHALPQTWRGSAWQTPQSADLDADEAAEEERERHVHLLGNLTLVTHALNSSLQNAPWSTKRLALADRSQLLINQRLCAHEHWDEELIDARGAELADYVFEEWPGPEAVWLLEEDAAAREA
jgi:Protein of unknown function DUF262/Protein of unknown function (DUF1524)